MVAVDHALTIHGESGEGLWLRAARDHQVPGRPRLAGVLDPRPVLGFDHALALDHSHLVLLPQTLDAPMELVDDRILSLEHLRPIELHRAGLQSETGRLTNVVGQLRRMQEGLGGYAPAMQAGTAHFLLFNHGDPQTQLSPPDRSDVAGGSSADDGYVERLLGHMP